MNNLFRSMALIGLFALLQTLLFAQSPCVDSAQINPNAFCTLEYDPVCGCNGVTYGNTCEAFNWGGVTSWVAGVCDGNDCKSLSTSFITLIIANSSNVSFSDQSAMPNGQILSWFWDFGDGNSSTEQNPGHYYANSGNYQVCLTVKALGPNGQSCEGTYCQTVGVPQDCPDNCLYEFEYDLNGTALHAEFDFGDIDPPFFFYVDWSLDGGIATGNGLDFVHLFNEPGRHTLCATYPTGDFSAETCTVCKAFEVSTPCVDSAQIDFSIACPLAFIPVCGCDGKTYDNACTAYNYGGINSWTPGACGSICNNLFIDFIGENTGGSLTVWTFQDASVFPGGTISSWLWDFGNGQTSMEEAPSLNFLNPGEYEVCLTVFGLFADGTQCGGTVCKKIKVADLICMDPTVLDPNVLCPAIYAPVCGCDGITYPNECVAYYYNGVTDWTLGVCPDQCFDPVWVDSSAFCFEIFDPVCGCDKVTYPNECYAVNYGGVRSWTKGECCKNAACNALFDVEIVSGNTIRIINQSTNAEASALNFGDGSPLHVGVFDTISHTYSNQGSFQVCLEISNFAGDCSDTYCTIVNLTSKVSEPGLSNIVVEISPNPSITKSQVWVDNAQLNGAVLYDVFGKVIWRKALTGASFEIETESLPAGVYLIQVQTDKGIAVRKWVVAR